MVSVHAEWDDTRSLTHGTLDKFQAKLLIVLGEDRHWLRGRMHVLGQIYMTIQYACEELTCMDVVMSLGAKFNLPLPNLQDEFSIGGGEITEASYKNNNFIGYASPWFIEKISNLNLSTVGHQLASVSIFC